jgi:hypothetical protein
MAAELILDDNTIRSLAQNPGIVAVFPFFKDMTVEVQTNGCKCRRRAAKTVRIPDYARIRRTVVDLSPENKRRLKTLLRVTAIVVKYRKTDGQLVKVRF